MRHRPICKLLIPFIAGILAAKQFSPPGLETVLAGCLAALIAVVLPRDRVVARTGLVCLAILALGVSRLALDQERPPDDISHWLDGTKKLDLTGMVSDPPIVSGEVTSVILEIRQIESDSDATPASGKVKVALIPGEGDTLPQIDRGDVLTVRGNLRSPRGERNPGEFDYRAYLNRRGVRGVMNCYDMPVIISRRNHGVFERYVIDPVRKRMLTSVDSAVTGAANPLLKGLLIGDRGELSEEVRKDFSNTGVIHVLAVSGLHVGFVCFMIFTFLGVLRIPRKWIPFCAVPFLVVFVFIAGNKPSVTRAVIMTVLFLSAQFVQRKVDFYNIASAAAFIILIIDPQGLFDIGFQLSFSAVLSIVALYPGISTFMLRGRIFQKMRPVVTLFAVSLAAQLGTLPIVALYFNRIPSASVLLNLVVVPVAGVIILLGFASVLTSLISASVSVLYGGTCQFLIDAMIWAVSQAARIPGASWEVSELGPVFLLVYYLLLLTVFFSKSPRLAIRFLAAALVVLNLSVWRANLSGPDPLQIVYLDVGQGDCTLIRHPSGFTVLIDTGDRTPYFDAGERIIVPYLQRNGISRIDLLVLTHADRDHIGGANSVLENLDVDLVLHNGDRRSGGFRRILRLLDQKDIKEMAVAAGSTLKQSPADLGLFVVGPFESDTTASGRLGNANNRSVVIKMIYGETSFLFTGDAEIEEEEKLTRFRDFLDVDVLKAGHHGSRTSSGLSFLSAVTPDFAVISCGRFNRFKHPHPAVLKRLDELGIGVARTDLTGAVILESDGIRISRVR